MDKIQKLLLSSNKEDIILGVEFLIKKLGREGAKNYIGENISGKRQLRFRIGWVYSEDYKLFVGYSIVVLQFN